MNDKYDIKNFNKIIECSNYISKNQYKNYNNWIITNKKFAKWVYETHDERVRRELKEGKISLEDAFLELV